MKNCWHHANVLPDRLDLSHIAADADLNRRLDQLVASGRRVAIEYLLNPVDEDDVIQQIKNDDLLCHIAEYGASECTAGTQEDAEEANMHVACWFTTVVADGEK